MSNAQFEDKTVTKSEMKATEYLPSKWHKKGPSQVSGNDPWAAKETILLRILKILQ